MQQVSVNSNNADLHHETIQYNENDSIQKTNNIPIISKKILNIVGRTNAQYKLIGEGDKILLGLSGGKDSILLTTRLAHIQKHAPFKFDFLAMTVDYGRGGEYEYIQKYCDKLGVKLITADLLSINNNQVRHDPIRTALEVFTYLTKED